MQWWALKQLHLQPRIRWTLPALREAWACPETQSILRLMGPALLGVSVAHISMLINTQIASHLRPGSVSWITYADRLMEFPTALLGVAMGVVLMPQLAIARASGDDAKYSSMIDWGLRLVALMAMPCAVALLVFPTPLVAVLYHYGAMTAFDVLQVTHALMGWGTGLIGIVAIKVLAPGYYASQDTKTPVRVAIGVLIFTHLLKIEARRAQPLSGLFLSLLAAGAGVNRYRPVFAHAALTLSIGIGAMVNALWLLVGLIKRGSYKPEPGWGVFLLQVLAGCVLLAIFLMWANGHWDWTGLHAEKFKRIWLLTLILSGAAAIYFAAITVAGLQLRQLLRR